MGSGTAGGWGRLGACAVIAAVAFLLAPAAGHAYYGVTAKWGSDGNAPGQFHRPAGIAVTGDGTVYVADSGNRRIQVFTSDGTHQATWPLSMPPVDLDINPYGHIVALMASGGAAEVHVFSPSGALLTKWKPDKTDLGSGDIATDGSADVYISSSEYLGSGDFIARYSIAGALKNTWSMPQWSETDHYPVALAADGDNLYVGSNQIGVDQVIRFGPDGTERSSFDASSPANGLAVDGAGNLLLNLGGVFRVRPDGYILEETLSHDDQSTYPENHDVDAAGNVYVVDSAGRVLRYTPGAGGPPPKEKVYLTQGNRKGQLYIDCPPIHDCDGTVRTSGTLGRNGNHALTVKRSYYLEDGDDDGYVNLKLTGPARRALAKRGKLAGRAVLQETGREKVLLDIVMIRYRES